MALSQVYGRLQIPMVGEDEPVFIIRAQDMLAESAMQMYRLLAEAHGCQVGPVLTKEISSFRQWQGERRLPRLSMQDKPEETDRIASVSRRH